MVYVLSVPIKYTTTKHRTLVDVHQTSHEHLSCEGSSIGPKAMIGSGLLSVAERMAGLRERRRPETPVRETEHACLPLGDSGKN